MSLARLLGVRHEIVEIEEFLGFSAANDRRVSFCRKVRGCGFGFVLIDVLDIERFETDVPRLVAELRFRRKSMPIVFGFEALHLDCACWLRNFLGLQPLGLASLKGVTFLSFVLVKSI